MGAVVGAPPKRTSDETHKYRIACFEITFKIRADICSGDPLTMPGRRSMNTGDLSVGRCYLYTRADDNPTVI